MRWSVYKKNQQNSSGERTLVAIIKYKWKLVWNSEVVSVEGSKLNYDYGIVSCLNF